MFNVKLPLISSRHHEYAPGITSHYELICHLCSRKFTSYAALKRHNESKHTNNLVSYVCHVCNKTFKTKWSLSTHTSRFHRKSGVHVQVGDEEAAPTTMSWIKEEAAAAAAAGKSVEHKKS